ncbi:MAG: anaerobic ribonucleoside-triphosphate reductase activating protein [Clostridia bacterium]|nr:anaerobic ribonucleoside-triphosphate reductase activating protein [Clostridia bacterium]
MYVANVKFYDIANGEGVRTSLFVSGCRHHCKNCFNAEAWDFTFGTPYTKKTEEEIIASLAPDYIAGLTVLGGEPFEPENQAEVLSLVTAVKSRYPHKTVWVYSGFTYEELLSGSRAATDTARALLQQIDVLVDGRFIEEQKNISLAFRGSENQRLIDLPKTLQGNTIVLYQP